MAASAAGVLKGYVVWATIGSVAVFHFIPIWVLNAAGLIPTVDSIDYSTKAIFALLALLAGIFIGESIKVIKPKSKDLAQALSGGALNITIWGLVAIALIVIPWSVSQARYLYISDYGDIDPVHPLLNLLMYLQLTLLPLLLLGSQKLPRWIFVGLLASIILPRLIISIFGPRFLLLQALLPTLLYLFSVYRVRIISPVALISGFALVGYLFVLNPVLRGDQETLGLEHLAAGSPVNLIPIADTIGIEREVTQSLYIPCGILRPLTIFIECPQGKIVSGEKQTYRFDFAMTAYVKDLTGRESIGTGGNPLIETGVIYGRSLGYVWFFAIGLVAGVVLKSAYVNIWCLMLFPHVATKVLFLWRGTAVEFFDRIPLILASTAMWLTMVMALIAAVKYSRLPKTMA